MEQRICSRNCIRGNFTTPRKKREKYEQYSYFWSDKQSVDEYRRNTPQNQERIIYKLHRFYSLWNCWNFRRSAQLIFIIVVRVCVCVCVSELFVCQRVASIMNCAREYSFVLLNYIRESEVIWKHFLPEVRFLISLLIGRRE